MAQSDQSRRRAGWAAVTALGITLAGGACVGPAQAGWILQPDEAQSRDAFVYEFLSSFNFDAAPYGGFLGVSTTSGTPHQLRSMVQFDLTGLVLETSETASLDLYVTDAAAGGFPFVNPSPAAGVVLDVYANTQTWNEATVTWATQPPTGATPVGSVTVTGIDQWVTVDVTDLVRDWLDGSLANNGLTLVQRAAVVNGGAVAALFASSATPTSTLRPQLVAAPVPEPVSLVLLGGAAAGVLLRRGRRCVPVTNAMAAGVATGGRSESGSTAFGFAQAGRHGVNTGGGA